jgi:Xaa-Pro aminopeptidase
MTPERFREMRKAIRGEGLDGWLFCNFHHRDPLADEILGIDSAASNSRLWLYAVFAAGPDDDGDGAALAILHDIERDCLGPALPGKRALYRGRDELRSRLAPLAGKRWGCHFSDTITAISYLDAGTAALLEQAGLTLVPAAGLLQRFKGLLGPAAVEAHERAAGHLYAIVERAWDRVRRAFAGGAPLYEGDIQQLMLDEFTRRGLITDHPPIVAAGANSGRPHYEIAHNGDPVTPGDVIQFDLWAKENGPGGMYADISWVGVYAADAPPALERAFANLTQAREGALRFIQEELAAGRRPSGADVDRTARELLTRLGYAGAIRHRTGHGIDSEVHGSGVNMDSVEFPDSRLLLDGSCFSLEPGIYFEEFGMRTEINVYISEGRAVVSGAGRQSALLRC